MYYPPPAKIPEQVLNTMKMNDNVAYAALPKELKGRRNMVSSGRQGDHGRFRSGKQTKDVSAEDTFGGFLGTHCPIARTRHSHI
jgi:PAB-dependent poly(A)-specific ribonuclease subunit 2